MGKIIVKGIEYTGGDLTSLTAWSTATAYKQNDVVIHNGVVYAANSDNTGNEPSATSEYWTSETVGDAVNTINHKVQPATSSSAGIVKPDGTTITIDESGTISASGSTNYIKNITIPSGTTSYDISSDTISATSLIDVCYSADSLEYAQSCTITYTQVAGKLTITFASATTQAISVNYVHVID